MRLVFGPLGDPAAQDIDIMGRERFCAALLRRHPLLVIVTRGAGDQLAGFRFAGNNRDVAGIAGFESILLAVEPQAALALVLIQPVTREAILR